MSAAVLLALMALQALPGEPAPRSADSAMAPPAATPIMHRMAREVEERAPTATLQAAVEAFRRYWARADGDALVSELAAEEIRLDLGSGRQGLLGRRQARATLRDFLSPLETVALEVERVAEVGGSPPRGFAELAWTARAEGTEERLRYTLFAGFVRDGDTWRLAEVRILR